VCGRSHTKPGSLLKDAIKIRTWAQWDDGAGVEIDLVGHEGGNALGEHCYTLTATDVATGWTENRSVPNKARKWVIAALEEIAGIMPFPLLGVDSDNGSVISSPRVSVCDVRHEAVRFRVARSGGGHLRPVHDGLRRRFDVGAAGALPGPRVESWTVLGEDDLPVAPVERHLAYLTAIERSPNTAKAYAHDLKDFFVFLTLRSVDWRTVRLEDVADFVARLPTHASTCRAALYRWLARCEVRDAHGLPVQLTPHQWRHTLVISPALTG
jgi:hypothetical protein